MTNKYKSREIANNNCTHANCSHGEHYFTSELDCYKAAMEMAEYKDKYYEPLVTLFVNTNEYPENICSEMDDDWCDQHCNSFSNADCVRKWLDLKYEKLSENGK